MIREVAREKQLRIVDERKRIYDKGKKRKDYEVPQICPTAKFAPDQVQWTEPMQQAFVSLNKGLCDHVILSVPCQSDSFVLCTD